MSSVSSRQESGTVDGEGNMSDIDDILDDDDLPIVIPDAAYVLKRDDMDDSAAPVSRNWNISIETCKHNSLLFTWSGLRQITSHQEEKAEYTVHTPIHTAQRGNLGWFPECPTKRIHGINIIMGCYLEAVS